MRATAKLVKKLAMDTVIFTCHGSYLMRPRYDSHMRKGYVEYTFDLLFKKEESEALSEEEINKKLLECLKYNDFEWNSRMQ